MCSYERLKDHYTDAELIRFLDSGADLDIPEEDREAMKIELADVPRTRRLAESLKRRHDRVFQLPVPEATQKLTGKNSVVNRIAGSYIKKLAGLEYPVDVIDAKDPNSAQIGFLVKYVSLAAHVLLGAKKVETGGYFDKIEYHRALRIPSHNQKMFELVRLQLMIDGFMPSVRALFEEHVQDRIHRGLTLRDLNRTIQQAGSDEGQ